ncbi:MAG: bifunctional nuclease domain-containing protein [Candidatus Aenigmatarchaeota archaeon]
MDALKIFMLTGILLVIILLYAINWNHVEVDVKNYQSVDVSLDGHAVGLLAGCKKLYIETVPWKLESIRVGMEEKTPQRPESHDLIVDVININGKPRMVLINGLHDARLIISGLRESNMDAEPDDAIAVAVRTGIPIYVKKSFLESGTYMC